MGRHSLRVSLLGLFVFQVSEALISGKLLNKILNTIQKSCEIIRFN